MRRRAAGSADLRRAASGAAGDRPVDDPEERGREGAADQSRREGEGRGRSGRVGRPRILIVEDELMVALEVEAVLLDAGYAVVGMASDVDGAVRQASQARPDLVLMDIRLQGKGDGIAAAITIREQLGIPSIFVTANSDAGTAARGAAARPAGWVYKPFAESTLIEAVRRALKAG